MKSIFKKVENQTPQEDDAHTKHINFLDEKDKMEKAQKPFPTPDVHTQVEVTEGFKPSKETSIVVLPKEGPKCGVVVTCDSMSEMPTVANQLKGNAKDGCDSRSVPLSSGHFKEFVQKANCAPKGASEVPMGWRLEPHGLVKIQSQQPEAISKAEEKNMQTPDYYRGLPKHGIMGAQAGEGTAKLGAVPPPNAQAHKFRSVGAQVVMSEAEKTEKLVELNNRISSPKSSEDTLSELDKVVERLQKQNQARLESLKKASAIFPSDPNTMARLQKLMEGALEKYLSSLETDGSRGEVQSDLQEENDKLWQAHFLLVDQIKQLRAENEELRSGK